MSYKSNNLFQVILELSKVRITVAVALTTLAGYVLSKRSFDLYMFIPIAGIFFLACGASVINHLQEKRTDAKMPRTAKRPLPSGKISTIGAITLAVAEIMTGSLILYFGSGFLPFLLGISALIWYNLIYINLKKVTVHAVIPGSVIGSIPPLVGWVSAGGSLTVPKVWMLALFFFIWQVPHFYLLAIKYSGDYARAGFPSILSNYSIKHIRHMIFLWIAATACVSILLPFFNLTDSYITWTGIIVFSIWLMVKFTKTIISKTETFSPGRYFMTINYYVLGVVILLISDIYLSRII